MKYNQKGFGALEVLVVILIVGLIGTLGWLLYDRQVNKNSSQTIFETSKSKKEDGDKPATETLPAGYVSYKNSELGIKFNYPESWGSVDVSQQARNREEFEPIKTHFLSFSESSKFLIMISPTTWKFTGGASEWDFPETDDSFNYAVTDKYALQIVTNDSSYLQMRWNGIDGSVSLLGAKKLELSKIPAKYVEFKWASVSADCAVEVPNGMKPQASCYSQDLVDKTQKVLESFTTN